MNKLNFKNYHFRFKKNEKDKLTIFDIIRKKFIVLTPEEWVRQHCIHFLVNDKNIASSLINVEKELKVNNTIKRYDIIVYNSDGSIYLLVECKQPKVKITQEVFDQIARYNLSLKAELLMITNGLTHYFCKMNFKEKKYDFIKEI